MRDTQISWRARMRGHTDFEEGADFKELSLQSALSAKSACKINLSNQLLLHQKRSDH